MGLHEFIVQVPSYTACPLIKPVNKELIKINFISAQNQPDGQLQKTACNNNNNNNNNNVRGRDSSVNIATRYGLVGPGIES
jgi:hypothetical protein